MLRIAEWRNLFKQISRLAVGSLSTGHLTVEMTIYSAFYKALRDFKRTKGEEDGRDEAFRSY